MLGNIVSTDGLSKVRNKKIQITKEWRETREKTSPLLSEVITRAKLSVSASLKHESSPGLIRATLLKYRNKKIPPT
jgi:hypothetical protein